MPNNLSTLNCIPCTKQDKPLNAEDISSYLKLLKNNWEAVGKIKIRHSFEFGSFKQAMKFVNQVAVLAEAENHHPNIHILYNRVKIVCMTHVVGGLSRNDFILAAKIEILAEKTGKIQ